MKIRFSIPYRPVDKEKLLVGGSLPDLGNGNASRALQMDYDNQTGLWKAEIAIPGQNPPPFDYIYYIDRGDGALIEREGGKKRRFRPDGFPHLEMLDLFDLWRSSHDMDAILETAPFEKVFFHRALKEQHPYKTESAATSNTSPGGQNSLTIRIQVAAPRVPSGQAVYIAGEIPSLGEWEIERAPVMRPGPYPNWIFDFDIPCDMKSFSYKFYTADGNRRYIMWEDSADRLFEAPLPDAGDDTRAVIATVGPFRHDQAPWRGAGMAVPVFSLRTDRGMGTGEFRDLKELANWAKQMGIRIIQILPVNDTTAYGNWYDSYPYGVISVFALHPLYMNLDDLASPGSDLAREISVRSKELNESSVLDYEAVMAAKKDILWKLFMEDGRRFLNTSSFQAFFDNNVKWLRPYAAFCVLRDRYGTSDHCQWGADKSASPNLIDSLTAPDAADENYIHFHYYVQFHLHLQLAEASDYARSLGIILKGDIPIGVARGSVETWLNPQWFHMDEAIGAPPDDFSETGQNWGFPTYNWEAVAQDGYIWWRDRLQHMSRYFDAVRLDHIIGFFRIWAIPKGARTALQGRFQPALPLMDTELAAEGLHNFDRLCTPWITDQILEQSFGSDTDEIIRDYLDEKAPGYYRFKTAFQTQDDLASHMAAHSEAIREDPLFREKFDGLLRLHDNIILIPDGPNNRRQFHPRILMEKTASFQALDAETKTILRRFYEDYFFNRQEALWQAEGWEKLSSLTEATQMMICGEDLGMVPHCVPEVLRDLNILSLRIPRMPVMLGDIFDDPRTAPYLSVSTPGSHDMSTIRGWWEEDDRAVIQIYYQDILGHKGVAPRVCRPDVCREIIDRHLHSPSLLAVIPVQDLLAADHNLRRADSRSERINNPGIAHHQWNFRLHLTLPNLIAQKAFNDGIRRMIVEAGRMA
ncbi:MAG: 4-alpha-glucanotransferase [Syntrophus sp. SKADARSKE-3]|nr:4-alpha-glucanotransferase [Syntrophus sp. SKADARSKE-3]